MKLNKLFRLIIIILILIIFWKLLIIIFNLPPYILPSPFQVGKIIFQQFSLLCTQSVPTLLESLLGLTGAVILGALTALLMAYLAFFRRWLRPVLLISQALPTFAIAPIFVMWMGYGINAKIAVIILMLYFPIASNFFDGLMRVKSEFLDLAQLMNASRLQTLLRIRVPSALPHFAAGLRIAAAGAPMGAVIGEWVGASRGLGFLILDANARMQIDLMFAAIIFLVIWSFFLYFSIDFILKKILKNIF